MQNRLYTRTIFDVTAKVSQEQRKKNLVSLLYIRNTQWQTANVHEKVSSEKILMLVKEMFVQCDFPFLGR